MAEFPTRGRLAGIDFGTVRIGIALCNASQTMASPHVIHHRQTAAADAAFFKKLVAEEGVVGFVMGLPIHLSGRESGKSIETQTYGKWLTELTGLPVAYQDERFTTVESEGLLRETGLTSGKRKRLLDAVAAQRLLAAFLDSPRSSQPLQGLED